MRWTSSVLALLVVVSVANTASGQQRSGAPGVGGMAGPAMMMGGPGGPGGSRGAEFMLGHTGELQLTDAQVVRLAAVARRSDARRRAMHASMDSVMRMSPPPRPDSAGRRRPAGPPAYFEGARKAMEQMRDQDRADLRDAIAVLTPDQQAQAWEMVSRGGPGGGGHGRGGPGRGPGGPGMRMRTGGPDGPPHGVPGEAKK